MMALPHDDTCTCVIYACDVAYTGLDGGGYGPVRIFVHCDAPADLEEIVTSLREFVPHLHSVTFVDPAVAA